MKKNLYSKPGFLFLEGTGGTDLHLSWDDDIGFADADGAKKSQASDWGSFWDKNGETITGKSNFDLATPETYPEGFDPSDVTTYAGTSFGEGCGAIKAIMPSVYS